MFKSVTGVDQSESVNLRTGFRDGVTELVHRASTRARNGMTRSCGAPAGDRKCDTLWVRLRHGHRRIPSGRDDGRPMPDFGLVPVTRNPTGNKGATGLTRTDDDRVATCIADPGGVRSVRTTRTVEDRRRKSLQRVKVAGSEW
ncbi:hypothetical protein GCM10011609_27010 [Lentzea pudingi]|uniref:Uncharacterized protein n=1 Tax=Lentzea pudingi TaxID=1789439 RepID=A0ABQ2HQN4_9PSEU|nr:hypothetical protein GCM10011609_27010 [Lentzea pudingi]